MNSRRGWNLELEESYFLDYSEYEAETCTHVTKRFHIWTIKGSSSNPSPISSYSESSKMTSFYFLGFSSMKP